MIECGGMNSMATCPHRGTWHTTMDTVDTGVTLITSGHNEGHLTPCPLYLPISGQSRALGGGLRYTSQFTQFPIHQP